MQYKTEFYPIGKNSNQEIRKMIASGWSVHNIWAPPSQNYPGDTGIFVTFFKSSLVTP